MSDIHSGSPAVQVRLATPADAPALLAVYAPYVHQSAVTFELEPPPVDEFAERIREVQASGVWLVAEVEGTLAGYAYGGRFRARAAYGRTAETTVYLAMGREGQGIGRRLYEALKRILALQGFRTLVGGIVLPNPPSVRLHEAVGFRPIGVFHNVGNKFDQWRDVGWWELDLGPLPPDAPLPRPVSALSQSEIAEACAAINGSADRLIHVRQDIVAHGAITERNPPVSG